MGREEWGCLSRGDCMVAAAGSFAALAMSYVGEFLRWLVVWFPPWGDLVTGCRENARQRRVRGASPDWTRQVFKSASLQMRPE